ncbi:FAD-dependent oxidoreductase (plasmid) [Roseibium aggregatum]|nr:FAD-dependent oxidoreductase [Roseibium aggregatum]WJS05581.1 FAD-dependent oxidoreductase [Roseibium aggregatum]
MQRSGADVVIIGAGMAGLAVARDLVERTNASVVVLEAGPDAGHHHIRQVYSEDEANRMWLAPEADPNFWRPYDASGAHYLGISGLRRRVGGRSLYWGGALLPMDTWAFDGSWPAEVVSDLTAGWEGGAPLFDNIAAEIRSWADVAPLPTAPTLRLAGHTFGPTPHATRREGNRWAAYSPLDRIDAAATQPTIVPENFALGVLMDAGQAVGVRTTAGDIAASHVVLAAGTVENSRLALQALAKVDPSQDHRLNGLVDKIAQGFTLACAAEAASPGLRQAVSPGGTFHRTLDPRLRSNHFVRLSKREDGAIVFDTWLMGEQLQTDASAVHCTPTDDWPWQTTVMAALSQTDEELAEVQRAFLTDFWLDIREEFGFGGTDLSFEIAFGSQDLPERLMSTKTGPLPTGPVSYAFPLGAELHEAGTTPLGAMLTDTHEFKAIPRLYAAGPSSFSRPGAANPALSILALARRLAGKLACG